MFSILKLIFLLFQTVLRAFRDLIFFWCLNGCLFILSFKKYLLNIHYSARDNASPENVRVNKTCVVTALMECMYKGKADMK